ncbi:MAG: glutamate synthase [Desulfurococcales archaeon ex4484_58]|nr:MAG: glutamate synthase [Desulfurococcales archaeon ex4484_58]
MVNYMKFAFLCKEKPSSNNIKVAIIGAGPAGLAASGYLSCKGYEVDVYDKQPLAGGLMTFAIPPWRIPRENIFSGIKELEEKFGVKFILRTKIHSGKPAREEGDEFVEKNIPFEEIIDNYQAILITTGTWTSKKPPVKGIDAKGVYTAVEYLYRHRIYELGLTNEKPPYAKKVIVIGGGYSAVDAAEQALHDGAESHLVYRRTIKEAPAGIFEMKRIEREGVTITELASPLEVIVENGVVKGVKFQRMKLGPPDESGRPKPIPIPNSEFILEADLVVFATGERATPPVSPEDKEALNKIGIKLTKWNTIEVNNRMQTGNPKIFAAGDVVNGPSRIGPAIRSGLYAAKYLDNWLQAKLLKPIPSP